MMRTRLTKVLALILALVMTIGLLPMSAMAGTTAGELRATSGSEVSAADGAITGQKTITPVTGSTNQFDITLSVTTTSNSSTSMVTNAADVVMVLDVTNSMDYYAGDNTGTTKWSQMKSAASSFIDKLLPTGNTTNRVAIIIYAGLGYYVLQNWTEDAATAKETYSSADTSDDLRYLIDGKTTIEQYTYVNTYGTNCQAGFLGAEKQLGTANADSLKYVVYLTDGAANVCYKDSITTGWGYNAPTTYAALPVSHNAIVTYNQIQKSFSDNQPPATTCAILQAAQLKTNYPSAKLIAIGIGTDTDNAVINNRIILTLMLRMRRERWI
jgi:hypothetical protein